MREQLSKKDLVALHDDAVFFYARALRNANGYIEEQRNILLEIIELSKNDSRFTDPNNSILEPIIYAILTDYDVYKTLFDAPQWHNELIRYLAPHYFKVPFKWRKQFTDFVYSKFNNILEEKELSVANIVSLYDNLKIDGYNMDEIERPDSNIKPKLLPQFNIKEFVEDNFGRQITGTPEWFNDYVNIQSSFYAVSKYMPIGTIVGYKLPNKICFAPSDHWKFNGYPGHNMDFEYCGEGHQPMVCDVSINHVEFYDTSKLIKYGKPQNYKDFAFIYSGEELKLNSLITYRWKMNEPIGEIIGYSALKDYKGYIYYIPSAEFEEAGYPGTKPEPGEVIYTMKGMNDSNAPLCSKIKLDDVSIYTDPVHELVEIQDVTARPMPPKGSVDADHFAVKYADKEIKATYKYAHYLSAIDPWDVNKPIGTIIGVSGKRLCFAPSKEFQEAGWTGIINFNQFDYTTDNVSYTKFYTIDLADIELLSPEDYEHQNEGELITDDGLTANQKFATEYAGKNIIGKGAVWNRFLSYDAVIGQIAGYKGSLICYTPSPEMIKAGFSGQVIDNMIYTDIDLVGAKCYTLISSEAVRFANHRPSLLEPCYANHSKKIKGTKGMWQELIDDNGDKWNLDWPLGEVIGYHQIHNCICFVPSKKLREFGFNKGNTNYVGVLNHAKSSAPYYQLFDFSDVEVIKPKEKPKRLTEGAQFAQKNASKDVKKSIFTTGWDKTKVVGRVVGYKGSGSIIWVPTDEYAKQFPPNPIPEDAVIVEEDLDPNTLVHSCWETSLELVETEEAKKEHGFFKHPKGGWQWGHARHHHTANTTTVVTPKKKKKVKDRPWDKPINIVPLDMPPYIETNE